MLKSELFITIYHTIKSEKISQFLPPEIIKQLSVKLTMQIIDIFTISDNIDLSDHEIIDKLITQEMPCRVKPPILDKDYLK